MAAIEIWESYSVAADGPLGLRGYGWTEAAALADAHGWTSRVRRVVLADYPSGVAAPWDQRDLARYVFRHLEGIGHTFRTTAQRDALAHYLGGRYAQAWLALHPPTEPVQLCWSEPRPGPVP